MLDDAVRWEQTPDGRPFPHVDGLLAHGAVATVYHVGAATDVDRVLPPE